MNTQFTKGEWTAFEIDGKAGVLGPRSDIAHCFGYDSNRTNEENMANAYLIAASPKMYAALDAMAKGEGLPPGQTIEQLLREARGEK